MHTMKYGISDDFTMKLQLVWQVGGPHVFPELDLHPLAVLWFKIFWKLVLFAAI